MYKEHGYFNELDKNVNNNRQVWIPLHIKTKLLNDLEITNEPVITTSNYFLDSKLTEKEETIFTLEGDKVVCKVGDYVLFERPLQVIKTLLLHMNIYQKKQ
jgi:hypothetical protein